ncbi:hypothetical protein BVRB_016740 [Beta vulgaris subsp. vulgaris]|uniref:Uncharacterized protein n=1 Tax=Beta vulgaris subsp. vulgaris TaxID=3555 RepID=A0A0J8B0V7_BETVV|nr:hypothetical protein BVRB_016740 [Beta vulgaris subsp. vulgaris]
MFREQNKKSGGKKKQTKQDALNLLHRLKDADVDTNKRPIRERRQPDFYHDKISGKKPTNTYRRKKGGISKQSETSSLEKEKTSKDKKKIKPQPSSFWNIYCLI